MILAANTSVDRKSLGISTHCHNKVSSSQLPGRSSFLGTLRKMTQRKFNTVEGRRRHFSSIIKVVLPHLTCKDGFCGATGELFEYIFQRVFQPGRIMNNSLGPNTLTP